MSLGNAPIEGDQQQAAAVTPVQRHTDRRTGILPEQRTADHERQAVLARDHRADILPAH